MSGDYPGQNVPANSLANLLCHYNSDSDNEESKKDICKLDDQVNNFLKARYFYAHTPIYSGNASYMKSFVKNV